MSAAALTERWRRLNSESALAAVFRGSLLYRLTVGRAEFLALCLITLLLPFIPVPASAALILAAGLLFLARGRWRAAPAWSDILRRPLLRPILVFLAVMLLLSAFSVTRGESLQITVLFGIYIAFYLMCLAELRDERKIYALAAVFLVSVALEACCGLYQYFVTRPPVDPSWIDSAAFPNITVRVFGTLDNPNILALYLVPGIIFGLALALTEVRGKRPEAGGKRSEAGDRNGKQVETGKYIPATGVRHPADIPATGVRHPADIPASGIRHPADIPASGVRCPAPVLRPSTRVLFLGMAAFAGASLFYTWTRMGWLSLGVALAVFLLFYDWRLLLLAATAAAVAAVLRPDLLSHRLTSIFNLSQDSSMFYRFQIWQVASYMIRDFWFSGVGPGSAAFQLVYNKYYAVYGMRAYHTHNLYIEMLVEYGVFETLIFLWLLCSCFGYVLKRLVSRRRQPSGRGRGVAGMAAMAGMAGLTSYLFMGLTEDCWFNFKLVFLFWFLIAVTVSAVRLDDGARSAAAPAAGPGPDSPGAAAPGTEVEDG